MANVKVLSDPMKEWANDTCGANASQPALHDTEDIEEFPLLLQSGDVMALLEVARQEGLTAAGLARRLIGDYLRQTRSTLLVRNSSEGRRRS